MFNFAVMYSFSITPFTPADHTFVQQHQRRLQRLLGGKIIDYVGVKSLYECLEAGVSIY